MKVVWQLAVHTPVWVYLLLAYLIFAGIKESRPRVRKMQYIFITPVILTGLSLHTLAATAANAGYPVIGSWLLGMVLGSMLGWWQVKRLNIQIDKQHLLIHIPGTWSSLWILLAIFAAKYYFGYVKAAKPMLAEERYFKVFLLSVTGICTGLFVGKLFGYVCRYRTVRLLV